MTFAKGNQINKGCIPWNRGIPMSEEAKRKDRETHIGKIVWNKGKQGVFHHSEETKRRISETHKGFHPTCGFKKGQILSEESRKKAGQSISDNARTNPNFGMKGKHPSEETKRKISEAKKGERNPNYGKHHTEEWKNKLSESAKINPNYGMRGKHLSETTRRKISEARKGRVCSEQTRMKLKGKMRGIWQNPEYREKHIKAILSGLFKRPTSFEQKLIDLIKEHNLPFSYVGDGAVIINYVNPDFIGNNGNKQIIEVYYSWFKTNHNKKTIEQYEN